MTKEQKRDFRNSTLALSVGLFASVAFALVASFAILLVQLRHERKRIESEARSAKARRLRYKADKNEVTVPSIMQGVPKHFHTFLSHVWGTGQDQMRIIKQRLKEMLPYLEVFLDVDDLEEIGDLEGYIDRTSTILIYCSKGYFQSKNCMRELVSTTTKRKPIIALIDPDASRGGLSVEEVRAQLLEAQASYAKWGFDANTTPNGETLHGHLFQAMAIEWNRIGIFQDVTMRLIAERLLEDAAGTTYVDGELISHKLKALPPPKDEHRFHICCSGCNPGALELMVELAREQKFKLQLDEVLQETPSDSDFRSQAEVLCMTTNVERLAECDHLLLYLTLQTWTRGEESEALGKEVERAMDLGVHVLLTHEMPGAGGQEARFGCEFGSFFSCVDGATPGELLKRGIYSEIAVALKGGPWREASMAMLAMALGLSKEEAEAQAAGQDVLGEGMKLTESSLYHSLTKMRSGLAHVAGRSMRRRTRKRLQVATITSSTEAPDGAEENAATLSAADVSASTSEPLEIEAGDSDVRM